MVDAFENFYFDPYGFVMFSYPWGKKGTILANEDGPDKWQEEVLRDIGELTYCQFMGTDKWRDRKTGEMRDVGKTIQYAMKAGRDPGKTCLIAWILHWFITCRPILEGTVTANTGDQLRTKTWRELAKWWGISIHKHWFTHTSERFSRVMSGEEKTCFISAMTWSEQRPQAIAGAHEEFVIAIFDEASDIPDIIWETMEAGMIDPHTLWIVGGNPTRNIGRFKECFGGGKFAKRWITRTIDSREAKRPDKVKMLEWETDYGEDSDFFRVWVRGVFPQASLSQFIPENIVDEAAKKDYNAEEWHDYPTIFGVDIAREGGNSNVIYIRQGMQTREIFKYNADPADRWPTMTMTGHIVRYIQQYRPAAICVDAVGIGGPVCDRLRQLGHENVYEVKGGTKAYDESMYADRNAELWDAMKTWLLNGGAIPDDDLLKRGLKARLYGFDKRGRLMLQRKKDMEVSPDEADALAYTLAVTHKLEIRDTRSQAQKIMDFVEGRDKVDMTISGNRGGNYVDFGSNN